MEARRSFRHLALVIAAVGLGLIIIALVVVASHRQGPSESPKTEQAAAAPSTGQFVWYAEPKPAPATTFQDADGKDHTLADFAGKVLVVNFWATWCAPCVKEMPTLDALQAQLGGATFQVLAISQDREGAQVAKPFEETKGWKNLALYVEPPGHFVRDAALNGLPTSIVVNASGQEIGRVEGDLNWVAPEVVRKLRDLTAGHH